MTLKLAIVGRPNVGKSTLFNRLAGKKLAIVDDRPGVTRDRRYGHGRIGDIDLTLIDTAGFEDVDDDSLESRMRRQTEQAIDDCDAALFVVDAREGVTAADEIFGDILRRRGKPVVLIANKSEGRAGGPGAAEAFALGLGEPVALSAEHGEGLADLYAAIAAIELGLEGAEDETEPDAPVRIAVVGRPNAGKSTLINRLLGEDRLLTGPEAGITRDAIPVEWRFDGRRIRLVDTAGLRRKARVQAGLERLSAQDTLRAITFAEVVLLVMDATHPFEIQDLQIADLVEREGRALVFVLAKWDLIEDPQSRLQAFQAEAARTLPQLRGAPVVALSAETGRGLGRLMPAALEAHQHWSTRVKTRDLNDWLRLAIERHPPPAVNGRRVKPKYMAQTKARPPTFVLFASRAAQLPDSYRRYLINSLRESFDLPGVPVRLTVRKNVGSTAETQDADTHARPAQIRPKRSAAVSRSPAKRTAAAPKAAPGGSKSVGARAKSPGGRVKAPVSRSSPQRRKPPPRRT